MLENPKINIKLKLSALWTSLIALYIYGDYFELYVPGRVDKLINVTAIVDTPTKLFLASLFISIPSLMIALSVILKPKINRLLNIVFGLFLTLVVIIVGSNSLYTWLSYYVFYAFLEGVITLLIVWYAWKWPVTNNMSGK